MGTGGTGRAPESNHCAYNTVSPEVIMPEDSMHDRLSFNNTNEPVYIVASSSTWDEGAPLYVVPFGESALPMEGETSEHYGMRLHAYGAEYVSALNPSQFNLTNDVMQCLGQRLMEHGLRQCWQKKDISNFSSIRTVRLFYGDKVSRSYMPRTMPGWTWHVEDEPPGYNGDGWVAIDCSENGKRAFQNAVQDGVRSFSAFALLIK